VVAARALRLSPLDNVAVATGRVEAHAPVELDGVVYLTAEEIPLGHRMALRPILVGEKVLKFGVPIGSATRAIAPGELVHVHNIESDYIVNDIDHHED
jgi:hypothetical protein